KLRGKLGRREDGEPYIETESGHGYRFTALVREVEDFDLVIRKRTRSHIITHEIEETDAPAQAEQAAAMTAVVVANNGHALAVPTTSAVSERQPYAQRGALVMAAVVAFVAVA